MPCCIKEIPRWQMAGSDPSRQVHHYGKCHRRAENRACMETTSQWQCSDRPSLTCFLQNMSTDVTHRIFSCALLSKSLVTTDLSMSAANILSLVFTAFDRCLRELLRDWKAMPSRKSAPNIFLQWATSL